MIKTLSWIRLTPEILETFGLDDCVFEIAHITRMADYQPIWLTVMQVNDSQKQAYVVHHSRVQCFLD